MILGELLRVLESLIFSEGVDFWIWNNDSSSRFIYIRDNEVGERSEEIVQLNSMVWESWSILKVNVFSWQLFSE